LKAVRYGITTKYIYDLQGNLLADTDVNNNILHYYIYGAGLLEMVDSTGAYCYHFDATGNTVAMTNSSQNIANAYTNDPFGNILDQQETDPQPFKYVGQYGVMAEANGFCYMRARYYDPQVGRFVSEDPSGFGGGDVNLYEYADSVGKPPSLQTNLYQYASDNPINRIDPNGMSDLSILKAISGAFDKVNLILDTSGNWSYFGSVAGGAALGTAGAFVGGTPGAIAGGLLGGYIGGVIGAHFDPPSAGQLNYNEPRVSPTVIRSGNGCGK